MTLAVKGGNLIRNNYAKRKLKASKRVTTSKNDIKLVPRNLNGFVHKYFNQFEVRGWNVLIESDG